ncbi:ATP-dependent RNA helicase vasa-like isoform X2 [Apostichopus japonicus]|uniref:ATP-dependent RNA helicase vasa-like isoform X2 n=1 Tax=Stichopus japonicus TaxID=307972 RepID=UPI003AB2C3A3
MSEDWDTQEEVSNGGFGASRFGGQSNGTTSGLSGGSSIGGGRGRGRGRGLGAFGSKLAGVGGSNSTGDSGGFGRNRPSRNETNSGGDGWGDNNNSGGGFGSNRSKGFGSGGGGGFDSNRSGGFGSYRRGGGGGGCFNCGSTDHQKRDCPQGGGGGGGGGGCFTCGSTDHQKRDCPQGGGGGGGGGGACFNCGSTEHQKRDCPDGGGGGGGGGGSGECFKCHEMGHFARECPNAERVDAENGDDRPAAADYVPPEPSQDEEVIFSTIQKGINFDKYDDIPVEVSGNDPCRCINSFGEADLYDSIAENVRRAKYDKPTPVQKYGIPIVSAGRDLMACAQTGSGKTAAFLLPILSGLLRDGLQSSALSGQQCPQCIVVSPTRELAIQIFDEARKFSYKTMIKCVVIYGGTKVQHQTSMVDRGCNVLVATPGRLLHFINSGMISVEKVKYLVLDEADRMLDMGFGPDMEKLVNNPAMPKKGERHTLMFSATFPNEVQERAAEYLDNYLFLTVGRVGGANSDVRQVVVEVPQAAKKDKLIEILQSQPENDRTLVFTETKRGADFLASYLSQSGFPTTSIHGDREQREREEALNDFKRNRASVLVATSVASRGLDIPAVKHVVNFDLPSEIDDYVHRIGRTGRCGNTGLSTSFYNPEKDAAISRALIKILADAHQDVPEFLENVADSAIGTYHGNTGGGFGGRDTRSGPRRGGGGGGNRGNRDWNSGGGGGGQESWNSGGGGGGGGGGGAAEDEEAWD